MKSFFKSGMIKPGMILAAALALATIPFHAKADTWDKKTTITVDQPIQVTNTYLEPGTYVLKLVNSSNDRHIVQIFNRDQNHLIDTVMAIPNYRLQPTGRSQFSFWETPPGTARAMRAWFYPGDNYGQEFRYPTELRQIAAVTQTTTTAQAAPLPAPPPVKEPEPEPQAPVAQAPPAPEPEPQQLAQNSPPPAPPQAAPAPAPEPSEPAKEPEELPKTASPYPLIGLTGLLSAGLFALVRFKRLS
jgi:hypothetical protein